MTTKTFTAVQIDKLRVRFAEYREKYRTRPNELRSIECVLQDMEICPDVPKSFFDGRARKTLDNALWRFSCGKRSHDETLDALERLLIFKEAQPSDAFEEDEEEGRAVYGFMANSSSNARRAFERIREGAYLASDPNNPRRSIHLDFICDPEEMVVWVEEYCDKDDFVVKKNGATSDRRPEKSVRKGYGFLSTERYLLHIFVVGNLPRDRVHYIEMDRFISDGDPFLLRVGGADSGITRTFPQKEMMPFFGVLHFTNIAEARAAAQRNLTRPPAMPDHRMRFQGPNPNLVWGILPQGRLDRPHAVDEALIEAVKANAWGPMKDAMRKDADPNFQDADGMTALHHAAALNSRISLRLLIASGKCNYLIPDNRGRYPSDLAIEWSRDFAVARLLARKRLEQADDEDVEPRRRWRFK